MLKVQKRMFRGTIVEHNLGSISETITNMNLIRTNFHYMSSFYIQVQVQVLTFDCLIIQDKADENKID